MLCSGYNLDQAIHELVEVLNASSVWLQARPRIPWELAKGTGKRNGKREQPYTRPGKEKVPGTTRARARASVMHSSVENVSAEISVVLSMRVSLRCSRPWTLCLPEAGRKGCIGTAPRPCAGGGGDVCAGTTECAESKSLDVGSRPMPIVLDADAALMSMEEPGTLVADWRVSAKYHEVLIKDGGGVSSTLDWQVPPAEGLRDSLSCVRKALFSSMPVDACARLRSRFARRPLGRSHVFRS